MKEILVDLIQSDSSNLETILIVLVLLLFVNILTTGFKFIADYKLKKSEVLTHKKNLILERDLDIQEKLYRKFEMLTLFFPSSDHEEMLTYLIETEQYCNNNNLFLSNEIKKLATKIFDYHKLILNQPSKKDLAKESKFLNDYVNSFRK